MKHKKTGLLQIVITVLMLLTVLVCSDSAKAVTISPLTFELNANPGDSISNTVRIYNDTDSEISIKMEAENFVAAGERGGVLLKTDDVSAYSLQNWISLNPEVFSLAPGSRQTVEFTVKVPANGEPGGHYASVLASVSSGSLESTGVGIAQKIGSLILLSVSGEVVEKMNIVDFVAPEFTEYGPKSLTVRFSNSGTVHIKPLGFVHIKNMFGEEVAKIDIPQMNVLPQSVRKIDIPIDLDYQIGKYEATLVAIYGSTNEPISAVTEYWVVPWKIILVCLTVLIIIIVFLYLTRKRWRLALKILLKGHHSQ